MYDLLLVSLNRRGYEVIGNIKDLNEVEQALIPFCEKFQKELLDGKYIFVAKNMGSEYYVMYRATYADWKVEEGFGDNPFYIDVAESDERVMFHRAVNVPITAAYDCAGCHKIVETDDCNYICEECIAKI